MLLHQRIDYSAPASGENFYLRIPMSSTLWTTLESRNEETSNKSLAFPSRIIISDRLLSLVFTGVDTSSLLRAGRDREYRFLWRIVPDPEDPTPEQLAVLPLGQKVLLTYSYGSSTLLSLSIGGVDVILSFDRSSRTLSSSWFTPPFSTLWSLELPRRILTRVMSNLISEETAAPPQLLTDRDPEPSLWRQLMCCRQ